MSSVSSIRPQQLPTENEVDAHLAGKYLDHFIRQAWKVIEPGTEFIPNWHIEAICEHLEAVLRWDISRLIINIPPRHMKSLICSVFFPAWAWITQPYLKFVYSSYAQVLSTRDNVKTRRVIQSPWYQANWGHLFQFAGDQNQKTRFENTFEGFRIATSVDGTNTGEGGDILVADDPNNVKETESDVTRNETNVWYDEVMSTRINNPKKHARIVIQQRSHENDVTGHLLAKDAGYEHLVLPCHYEPKVQVISGIDFEDPRTEPGELLWPERFDKEYIIQLELDMGEYASAGQLEQTPHPRGGGMFKIDRFVIVNAFSSKIVESIRYWDKAATAGRVNKGKGAHTAGVLVHRLENGNCGIGDCTTGKWSSAIREARIRLQADIDGHNVVIWMEQEPGSSGIDSIEASIKGLMGFRVHSDRVTGAKEVRAEPYSVAVENRTVEVLRKSWTVDFIKEHESFPVGRYRDRVDAAGGAFAKMFKKKKRVGVW